MTRHVSENTKKKLKINIFIKLLITYLDSKLLSFPDEPPLGSGSDLGEWAHNRMKARLVSESCRNRSTSKSENKIIL